MKNQLYTRVNTDTTEKRRSNYSLFTPDTNSFEPFQHENFQS